MHMDEATRRNLRRVVLIVLVLAVVLSACAAGPNGAAGIPGESGRVAGFWLGLWHGLISPITFVISLFNDHVNVYEIHNNGGWYNFGFVLAAVFLIGGTHGARRGKRP
jgi:hypothetical protein